jgi:hypothetical protein
MVASQKKQEAGNEEATGEVKDAGGAAEAAS